MNTRILLFILVLLALYSIDYKAKPMFYNAASTTSTKKQRDQIDNWLKKANKSTTDKDKFNKNEKKNVQPYVYNKDKTWYSKSLPGEQKKPGTNTNTNTVAAPAAPPTASKNSKGVNWSGNIKDLKFTGRPNEIVNAAWANQNKTLKNTIDSYQNYLKNGGEPANIALVNTSSGTSLNERKKGIDSIKAKVTLDYLNVGRVAAGEHKEMWGEVKTNLAKNGIDFNSILMGSKDRWNEKWLDPQKINNPKVMNVLVNAYTNEMGRMKQIGVQGFNVDNTDFASNGKYSKLDVTNPTVKQNIQTSSQLMSRVIDQAHNKGLVVFGKNSPYLVQTVGQKLDGLVTEEAFKGDNRTQDLPSYIKMAQMNKPVINFEVNKSSPMTPDDAKYVPSNIKPYFKTFNVGSNYQWVEPSFL